MYDHKTIEKKWQNYWETHQTFKVSNPPLTPPSNKGGEQEPKPGYYCLDMFPYPSGAGLHVGHPEGFTANDIVARYKHACGYNVLHPMGWDAFGLPAENYAIKTGTHPRITTDQNIATFKKQLQALGFSYDWNREIDTTDPNYYKWTQWIFLKLFEKGLAYEQDLPINYCPSCKTGLANEEVLNDFTCERCGAKVEKKKIRQWVLAITKYAERLLQDVDKLDWPESIKDMQRNWIGKSEGCEFEMRVVAGTNPSPRTSVLPLQKEEKENLPFPKGVPKGGGIEIGTIRVYTTRIDTVFSMAFAVIAPDHPQVQQYISDTHRDDCNNYIETSAKKSDQDRTGSHQEKTGVFTGNYVINPYNGEKVPLWIGDFVLGNYGTGAVFGDAHDERDYVFAERYNIPLKYSIAPYITLTGKETPRSNEHVHSFRCATAIIENVDDGRYLALKFTSGEYGFVGGGLEEGETIEECIQREIIEETGFKNFEIKRVIYETAYGREYKARKNREEEGVDTVFYVQLLDDTQAEGHSCDEHQNMEWFDETDLLDKLGLDHHLEYFKRHLAGPGAYTDDGILINSGEFTGLMSAEAREKLTAYAEEKGFGEKKVNYKLRDWLFSRQRYWGEPIPIVHCEHCGIVGEKEENLPILLPDTDNFEPSGDGTSPLSQIESFVHCKCPTCGGPAKRETNTMPQWGGSCWYYLRFMDPTNPDKLVDPEVEKYWGQVDSYVGGAEHAVLHLLYARFWHKFLFDIGVVSHDEPFYRLRNQGLILAHAYQRKNGGLVACDLVEEKNGKYYETGTGEEVDRIISKMSKSLKNVINPDDIVEEYGADSLRLYEMYMAEFKDSAPWDTKGIIGVRRFLDKVERIFGEEPKVSKESDNFTMKLLHKTIKKVQEDIENYKFNTAIAQMMILVNNGLPQDDNKQQEWKQTLLVLLHPFAPHLAEELWERREDSGSGKGKETDNDSVSSTEGQCSIFFAPWPLYDPKLVVDDTITIGVQVLGKLRGEIEIAPDEAQASVLEKAKANENVAKWLEGKELVKEIYVPGKIVNLVVR